jgi:hypothetical protein
MTKCYLCKKDIGYLPFKCRRCGRSFCSDHRLPEDHLCPGLKRRTPIKTQVKNPGIPKSTPEKKPITIPIHKDPILPIKTPSKPKKIDETIDNIPRMRLQEIIKKYDETIVENPKRLRALLKDLCLGQNAREINAIMSSLEEKIPHEILKSKNTVPWNILSSQLKKRLSENTYYSDELVTWSINSWALALGVQNISQK